MVNKKKDMKILKNLTGAVVFSGFLAVSSLTGAAEHDGQGSQPEQKLKPYTLNICVVSDEKLDGSMGKPFVYKYKDREIKFCCKNCQKDFDKNPANYIKKLEAAEKAAKDAPPGAPAHDHSGHQHSM
jgi:YHS domain-containing protein